MNSLLLAMRVARYTPRSVTRVGAWTGANVGWVRKGKSRTRLEENLHRVTGLTGRDLARLSRQGMLSAGRYYAEVLEMPRITEHQADARCRLANPEPVTSHIHEANGAGATSVGDVLRPRFRGRSSAQPVRHLHRAR